MVNNTLLVFISTTQLNEMELYIEFDTTHWKEFSVILCKTLLIFIRK